MRFVLLGVCAFLFSGLLSACGFTPLYGEHAESSSPGVVEQFSRVAIRPIPDRQGQRLSQILHEELQPSNTNGPSQYDLDVTLTSRVEELGIRKDATSSRANFILEANFYLSSGGQRLFGDRVQTIVGYNILDDQYATVAAQGDAQERAIEEAGREIKTRLGVFFKKRAAQGASTAH